MDEPPALLPTPAALEAPSDDATSETALPPVAEDVPAREDAPTMLLDCVTEDPPLLWGGPDVPPKGPLEDVPAAEPALDDPLDAAAGPLDTSAVQPPPQTIRIVAAVLQTRRVMNMVCRSLEPG